MNRSNLHKRDLAKGPEPGQSSTSNTKLNVSQRFPKLPEKWADIQTSESEAAHTPKNPGTHQNDYQNENLREDEGKVK